MPETLRERMTRGYANMIIIDGTRTFATIPAGYVVDVKAYCANTFTLAQIDAAYARGSITESEWQEIVALKPAA
jgi:allantoicase